AAQLASVHAQVESLRRQLRAATDPVTQTNIDPRVREILDSASADAVRIRNEAEAYVLQIRKVADEAAERVRATARDEADDIVQTATARQAEADEEFRRRIAEADRYRVETTERMAADLERTRRQEEQITAEADLTRTRLDGEAAQRRAQLEQQSRERITTAEQDFEITLRLRRTEQANRAAKLLAAAHAEAAEAVSDARIEARRRTAEAGARVEELDRQRNEIFTELGMLVRRLSTIVTASQSAQPVDATDDRDGEAADTQSGGPGTPLADSSLADSTLADTSLADTLRTEVLPTATAAIAGAPAQVDVAPMPGDQPLAAPEAGPVHGG
ncbi:MAG: hypothetical protein JO147_11465, partial [Actinobacteria bacterium]|nr:hypothetical protein [Actinomycetota bacterium]